jgi:tellurite resistance protein TerC
MVGAFAYLHYGLAAVLAFVGLKMIGEWSIPHAEGTQLIPSWLCLIVIALLLGASIAASMLAKRREEKT